MKPATLIGCGILRKEISMLIKKNNWPVKCEFSPSALHVDFAKLEGCLLQNLEKFKDANPLVFYGTCHPRMSQILDKYGSRRTLGQNCIEILIGHEKFDFELKHGAFFLLEEWAHTWMSIIPLAMGDNPELWKEIFSDQHKYVLAIRTPYSGDFTERAKAFSDAVGLPLRWMDSNTDILEENLSKLFQNGQGPE